MLRSCRHGHAGGRHGGLEFVDHVGDGRLTRRRWCIMRRRMCSLVLGLDSFAWRRRGRSSRLVFWLAGLARLPLLGFAIIDGLPVGTYFLLFALPLGLLRCSTICSSSDRRGRVAILGVCRGVCGSGRLSGSCRSCMRIRNTKGAREWGKCKRRAGDADGV